MLKKNWLWLSITLVILLLIGELIARFGFGLGEKPVFIENKYYEYIYAPNQDVKRFGNRIMTNEFSMRSKPLSKKDKIRVLLIGDSVINGGAHVDQEELVSSRLEKALGDKYSEIRVLNISSSSWGPDNAFAYIKQHGHFDAEIILMVFSSHDYNDNMHFKKVVGEHSKWPENQPLCALCEGVSNYLWPKIKSLFGNNENEYAYLDGFDDTAINSGWQDFKNYADNHKIQLLFYHHPETNEITNKKFNNKGQSLIKHLDDLKYNYINGLSFSHHTDEYRDNIHLNDEGHKKLAEILYPVLDSMVANVYNP